MKFIKEEIYQALQYQRTYNVSFTKAAEKYGVSRHTLSTYTAFDFSQCIHVPAEHQYILFTEREQEALDAYRSGKISTITQIRQEFGFHHEKFAQMCQYANIPVILHNTQHIFNRQALQAIDTECDAYILGFLTADAYICEARTSVRIKLSNRDEDILHKINAALQSNVPIHYETHNITGNTMCRLELSSRIFVQNLKQYGLHQAKSLKETFYQGIPEHLVRHYIRGLIDGDGFITQEHGHIGMCGSYDVLLNVSQQIAKHIDVEFEPERKLRCETTNRNKPLWRFELSGPAAKAAMRWLYEGSNIHLDRKYNLAKQYINLL